MGERSIGVVDGNLGETLAALRTTIAGRAGANPEESYTARLLGGKEDKLLGKIIEEAGEVALAAKDCDHDHIRYEAADLIYHLLVACERFGITNEELAGELNIRMK